MHFATIDCGLAVKKSAYVPAGHCAEKGLLQESNNVEQQGEDVPRATNYDKGWMVQPAKGRANQIFRTCSQSKKNYMNNGLEY